MGQAQNSPARLEKSYLKQPRNPDESLDTSPTLLQPRRLDLSTPSTSTLGSSTSLVADDLSQMQSADDSEATLEKARTEQEISSVQSTLKMQMPSPLRSGTSAQQPSHLVLWRREIDPLYTQHQNLIGEILAFIEGGTRTPERCEELKRSLAEQSATISQKLDEKRLHLSGTNYRVFTGELTNRVRRLNELLDAV